MIETMKETNISEEVLKLKVERFQTIFPFLTKITKTKNTDIAQVCNLSVDVISNVKNNRSKLKQHQFYELISWLKHTTNSHPNLSILSTIYDSFTEYSTIKHEKLWGLFCKTILNAFSEGADFEKFPLAKETIKEGIELTSDEDVYLKKLLEQETCASDYSISELPNVLDTLSIFCNDTEKEHIQYFMKKLYFYMYQVWEMSYNEINSYTIADIPTIAIELSRQPHFHPVRGNISSIINDDGIYTYYIFGSKYKCLMKEEYYTVIKVLSFVFNDIKTWIQNNVTNRVGVIDNSKNDEIISFTRADGSTYTSISQANQHNVDEQ